MFRQVLERRQEEASSEPSADASNRFCHGHRIRRSCEECAELCGSREEKEGRLLLSAGTQFALQCFASTRLPSQGAGKFTHCAVMLIVLTLLDNLSTGPLSHSACLYPV